MGEKLKSVAGVDLVGVPYKGGAPAITDLMSNQVNVYFDGISNSLPQVNGGALKTFGTTGEKRSAIAPTIPTLAEQGYPMMTTYFWIGLFAPAGTPAPVIERINAVVRTALAKPEVVKRLDLDGVESTSLSPAEFAKMIVQSSDSWREVVAPLNLKLD
jgi:tripartite-type tricarboxylate transporter receptor subunit TctC